MTRWKAFGIHLGISAVIGLAVVLVIALIWYPPPLLHATGSDRFLLVLIGVDVVIGPVLTLLVFKPGKPSLRFDLTVIALLQLTALGYGLWIAASSRPVFLVEATDRIVLVRANQIPAESLEAAKGSAYEKLSWTGPVLVGSRLPESVAERNRILFEVAEGAEDVERRPQYYVPYDDEAKALLQRARQLPPLFTRAQHVMSEATKIAKASGESVDDLRFVPLVTGHNDVAVVLSRKTGRPVGMIAVDPW
jgi:hypothetical protein